MNEQGLSPVPSTIDRILQFEASVQLRISEAHNQAEARLIAAQEEAAYIRKQAEQQGKNIHTEQYQNTLAAARQEASVLIARAQAASRELRERGQSAMPGVVDWIVDTILSIGVDGTT